MGLAATLLCSTLLCVRQDGEDAERAAEVEAIRAATGLIGLEFDDAELDMMRGSVRGKREVFERLRRDPLDNSVFPALTFSPLIPGIELRRGVPSPSLAGAADPYAPSSADAPADLEELAYATIGELAPLIRARKVSC